MRDDAVYMMVTQDKYELPLAVANSAAELARIVGVSKIAVHSGASRNARHGTWSRFRRVTIPSDDEED